MKRWKTDGVVDRRRFTIALAGGALALAAPAILRAEASPVAGSGVAPEKLAGLGDYMRNEVATGKIPGAIVLIQQHGKPVYFEKFGVRSVEGREPMTEDTIFRLYSMSKPITSVAAMMLVDDGKLALGDPLSKYISAFGEVKVGVENETLQRPITIEDLLRHTSGLTYGFYGDTPVRKLYATSDLFAGDFDNAEFAERLARLPLAEQPATRWDYGHSTDILGRVVEVVSGQTLFEFERLRLLDPLGMTGAAFYVADEAKRSLLAEPLPDDRFTHPVAGISDLMRPRRWQSGGAGMVGTIGDYARFAQMLLNGGNFEGRRYLKPETVALMTSDRIGPATHIARGDFYFPGDDSGFGLGFAVRTSQPSNTSLPLGEYRWDGVAGTFFFIDPRDDLFLICMMQSSSQRGRIETEVKQLVYDARER